MATLLETKKTIEEVLLQRPDVIGVGLDSEKQVIRVYVNDEDIKEELTAIPKNMSGYPIEIVKIPGFAPLAGNFRSRRYRPVIGGVSASHPGVTAGTIGAVITDKVSGKKLFLSNNHVFANSDSIEHPRAREGDPIIQPGVVDGGDIGDDVVATLYRWVPFVDNKLNLVDAALAMPVDQTLASPYILSGDGSDMIQIHGIKTVSSPISVKKYGRTTEANRGKVIDWNFTVAVDYEDGITRNFTDQILAEIETRGGDSGSILLDENDNAVGLVFAGGMDNYGKWFGVANKIRNVLVMFGDDVDISDGWIETSITEPKPYLEVVAVPNSVKSSSISSATTQLSVIGIAAVCVAALWQHLNKRG